ncbi:MAG: HAMP domain-containing protein, partial [Betaproteobacteria bacterium]|nr:HAMP domain-containing protein [Betaproteobacteria bacterium]
KPELKDVLRTFKTADATDALFELTRAQLAGESAGKVSAADFAAQATAAIDLQYLFIDAASKGLENVLVTRVADTEAQLDSTLGLIGGLAIVAVLLGAALTRSVTGPLTSAVETANLIGDGKYDSVIDDSSNDEVGHLLKGLREVQDKLHRRAEEEKRWLAETEARAASERKLAEKIAEVVSQAGNGDLTQRVDVAGAEGFHADLCHSVNALLDAMTDGFAVVATEVRTLAQRSGSAAREIKALISDSVEKVQAGADLVHQAGVTMEEIVSSVNRVTNLMGEIAAASREQSGGIGQVNQAIVQMDDMTQQNAALVEEAAAAAESMQAQAEALFNSVTGYKV